MKIEVNDNMLLVKTNFFPDDFCENTKRLVAHLEEQKRKLLWSMLEVLEHNFGKKVLQQNNKMPIQLHLCKELERYAAVFNNLITVHINPSLQAFTMVMIWEPTQEQLFNEVRYHYDILGMSND